MVISISTSCATSVPRNTTDEVFQQIVDDFTAAENLPADYSNRDSKASSLAATAFLSKVYLEWAQTSTEKGKANQKDYYQKAVQYAQKVIDSGKYRLLDKARPHHQRQYNRTLYICH